MDERCFAVRYVGRNVSVDDEATVGNGVRPVDCVFARTPVATSPTGCVSWPATLFQVRHSGLLIQG